MVIFMPKDEVTCACWNFAGDADIADASATFVRSHDDDDDGAI